MFFPTPQLLRLRVVLALCWVVSLLTGPAHAAVGWTDISSTLVERLGKSGAKPIWPGGCSGVVANRLNGDVTIKVVGSGLWRSSDKGKTWQRIDNENISGRDETGWPPAWTKTRQREWPVSPWMD